MPNKKVSQNVRPKCLDLRIAGIAHQPFRLFGLFVSDLSLHPLVLLLVAAVGGSQLCFKLRREKNQYEFQKNIASNTRKFDYLFHTMIDFRFAKEAGSIGFHVGCPENLRRFCPNMPDPTPAFRDVNGFLQCRRLPNRVLSDGCHVWLCGAAGSPGSDQYRRFQCVSGRYIQFFGVLFVDLFARLSHLLYLSKYAEDYQSYTALARPVHLDKGDPPSGKGEPTRI